MESGIHCGIRRTSMHRGKTPYERIQAKARMLPIVLLRLDSAKRVGDLGDKTFLRLSFFGCSVYQQVERPVGLPDVRYTNASTHPLLCFSKNLRAHDAAHIDFHAWLYRVNFFIGMNFN